MTAPRAEWARARGLVALPALLALLLSAPCLRFSFLSDDFAFLQRARVFSPEQLLPDARSAFYRPISRELYFGVLDRLGPNEPLWGHALNALLLATAVTLSAIFARRLGGERFGTLSGIFLAGLGAVPILVGWVSCSQDLFAMIFLGAALNWELSGRRFLAVASLAAAILSKETAAFFVPGLVLLRTLVTGDRNEIRSGALRYLGLVALWAVFHPRIRDLALHGFSSGEGGYVGVDNQFLIRNAIRMAGTLVNIPPTGIHTPWPEYATLPLVAALALLGLFGWLKLPGHAAAARPPLSGRTLLWIGLLLGVFPAALSVASAKHWFPYYACIPAIGTSMLLALPFRSWSWRAMLIPAAVFLTLGVWYRGTDAGKVTLPAEANFKKASECLTRVEGSFRKLRPSLPDSARVYVTVLGSTENGVYVHLVPIQAMRTWYQNSTLMTLPAEFQDKTRRAQYLFWVNPACQVFEVSLPALRVRSPGARPDYREYQTTLRSYALGAWAAGDTDRGVNALRNMQEINQLSWDFDQRLAAALLLASGRDAEAGELMKPLPKLGREQALGAAAAALTPQLPRPGLDEAVFRVVGLDGSDAEAYRSLMLYFSDAVELDKAKRMAEKLLVLRPGDEEATAMLEAIRNVPRWEAVLVPAEGVTSRLQRVY